MQTVWAPAVTTLLYLVIFTVAWAASGRTVLGVPFADFLAPGLIVMAMLQNAFANATFSLLVGKMQGTIVDYLMPPLSTGELIAGLVGAAVTRAFLVGCAVWLVMVLWPGVHVAVAPSAVGALVRADGRADARLPRAADLDLGGQVRPCRGGHQFRRRAAVAAVGHLLLGRPARRRRSARSATPIPSSTSSRASATASSASADSPICWSARSALLVLNIALFARLLRAAPQRLENQELSDFSGLAVR